MTGKYVQTVFTTASAPKLVQGHRLFSGAHLNNYSIRNNGGHFHT